MLEPEKLHAQLEEADKPEALEEVLPVTKIHLDVESEGKRYEGDFVYKVPTLGDQIAIGRMKTAYLPQGAIADPNAALIVEQVCYLEITLQKPRPDWYQPFKLYDAVPISRLYAEAVAHERRFHGQPSLLQAAPQADAGSEDGAADRGDGEAPVGRKVQPAAKRRETLVAHGPRGG